MEPIINPDKCDLCLECIESCPNDVFSYNENKVIVSFPEDCIECMSCIDTCHKKAIYMGD
ncbi:MAG TPA: 4Fe-4S binding protein [Syntrophorhabdaceae bacterium]|nr:4Fe-4S binding protein [Syntrophorhabdaceae bacterium]